MSLVTSCQIVLSGISISTLHLISYGYFSIVYLVLFLTTFNLFVSLIIKIAYSYIMLVFLKKSVNLCLDYDYI